jgi:hypothetical protein
MIKAYTSCEPETCIDRARSVMESFFEYLQPKDKEKWYFGADIISGDPARINGINQLWDKNDKWYDEDDTKSNREHPRLRFIYVFYKLTSTIGVHSGLTSKNIDVKQARKAEMEDALMCMQVVRSIIYWGINRSNKN